MLRMIKFLKFEISQTGKHFAGIKSVYGDWFKQYINDSNLFLATFLDPPYKDKFFNSSNFPWSIKQVTVDMVINELKQTKIKQDYNILLRVNSHLQMNLVVMSLYVDNPDAVDLATNDGTIWLQELFQLQHLRAKQRNLYRKFITIFYKWMYKGIYFVWLLTKG